ncbi:MAG: 1-acylglycerol-3-phosphate O-acyltransferase [Clostridiales bacterium]|nr:1-acylglycerol-3-phosphate O-acyltransferase [Clostridiales bacterium]
MLLYGIAVLSLLTAILLTAFQVIGSVPLFIGVFALSYLVYALLSILICTCFTVGVDLDKPCENHNPIYRFFSNCVIESATQLLRIRLHVTGKEQLPEEKFLLVSNHRGAMDPLLEMGVLRKYRTGFVSKKELFHIPIIGKLMHKSFCLSLNRGNLKDEAKTILRAIDLVKEQKATVGIYPEGTRNPTDQLLPFKNGAFKIAQRANCPIVVAVIRNTELATKNTPFRHTDVYLDFIGVLDKDFVAAHNTVEVGKRVREMMEAALAVGPGGVSGMITDRKEIQI